MRNQEFISHGFLRKAFAEISRFPTYMCTCSFAGRISAAALMLAFAGSSIFAEERSAGAAQAASVAQQMNAIASNAAEQQQASIRVQAEAVRNQKMPMVANLTNLGRDGSAPPIYAPAKPITEPSLQSPSGQITPVTDGPEPTDGFYTTPWPGSPDFRMPSVPVDSNLCEALSATEADSLIKGASRKNQVDASLLRAVMVQESRMRPCAISTAGAMGLMQIMPGTADDLGLSDPFDPVANVDAGARYLKQLLDRYHGNRPLALAAYNAGPGRTDRADGIPEIPETIGYVSAILGNIPLF